MDIQTVTPIFFSPTGTTRKLVHAVIGGMGARAAGEMDLTLPSVRGTEPPPITGDAVIVAMPIYAMGIPFLVYPFLQQLKGDGKPVICMAVYGNISAGIAVQQLYRLCSKQGFIPVGAALMIAEHSYSDSKYPVAQGRPSSEDITCAQEFGRQFAQKLKNAKTPDEAVLAPMPYNPLLYYFKQLLRYNTTRFYAQVPTLEQDRCNHCGLCAIRCPMGAIDQSTLQVDAKACIRCCACVKCCNKKARTLRFRLNFPASRMLNLRAGKMKQPHICI
ncbi:EFR1 family ferrodoxin [Acetanaerobacterium elongatum]|uniref:4Fe-4S binding domain-containing protein n=1 Tax=Acetanaerobacterium elongatum TaxID=258515 RepID=A0A1H0DD19_9FIRM|nr:EFR1 family ferrodoxin [Acetanaerobacterium elongatum]SDN68014.1 4Fe-4S binding domain-containing protein [Acetanaerobacterium elongatum]